MAKFYGPVGFAEENVETAPGVYRDRLVEYSYQGDIVRNTRQLREEDKVNFDISLNNSISIVADAYAREHFFAIRYVVWSGVAWVVTDVDASTPPRLILSLGGVYNGSRPTGAPSAP